MSLSRYKLGELVELISETNTNLRYSSNDVRGMTITKEIIPTKANVTKTDLSKFLVVRPGNFIYNPRTHGKHIGFGYNNTSDTFIISWNNFAFAVKKSMDNIVLADYLSLHFRRDEWDREACFQSWGSSTEVFSWDAFCDMSIDLPSIAIQQKYVNIYNTMLANQKCYEQRLDDLKLSFEASIDKCKQVNMIKKMGDILKEVDNRNIDGAITNVHGINIDKQFIASIADMYEVDLTKYKLVKKGQFAFSGMQTGRDECIRISLYDGKKPIIISPAYTVLENIDRTVLSQYVMIWFSRKEIDRLGWFMSDASIRTNLDLDRFSEIEIPIPELHVQKGIVDIYIVYKQGLYINEKLKTQLKDLCPILIKGSIDEALCA